MVFLNMNNIGYKNRLDFASTLLQNDLKQMIFLKAEI